MLILCIFAGVVALAAAFMLAFLKALTQESRFDRERHGGELHKKPSTFQAGEPYQRRDRAA